PATDDLAMVQRVDESDRHVESQAAVDRAGRLLARLYLNLLRPSRPVSGPLAQRRNLVFSRRQDGGSMVSIQLLHHLRRPETNHLPMVKRVDEILRHVPSYAATRRATGCRSPLY